MKLMDEFKDLFQNEIKSYLKKKIYLFFPKEVQINKKDYDSKLLLVLMSG